MIQRGRLVIEHRWMAEMEKKKTIEIMDDTKKMSTYVHTNEKYNMFLISYHHHEL